ncbi:MAG: hybrid sensor histidine kinase/response regulator [Desulfobacterales bacterium]|nr:hybrid sensor histidine kinase/response regulator [Desulfobacterales bacterium]
MEATKKKLILLVDDEQDIREVLAIALTDIGYDVLEAANGKQALKIFKEESPTIVLTDIKMPGIDGIEILKKIKQKNPETEVIMITGHGDIDIAIKSLKYEAIDFITKPISSDALEIALKRANEKIVTRNQLKQYTENLEDLLRQKSMLRDNLSSLGVMIGSISHGIKGLLTNLDGGVYLMESGFGKKDEQLIDEGFDILKLTIDRIKKMIFDILYYSKEREIKIKKINLLKFASDIADILEQKALSHGIKIVREFDNAPSKFFADPEHIRSALINILDNAVDACIEDKGEKDHKIIFTLKQDEKYNIFEIHDNGIGMDQKTREKIFNLFFSSKHNKGTGFGLFISKNIIQQHGGIINLKSAKGKGTCIQVKLPITDYENR